MTIWSWQHVSVIHYWVEPSLLLSSYRSFHFSSISEVILNIEPIPELYFARDYLAGMNVISVLILKNSVKRETAVAQNLDCTALFPLLAITTFPSNFANTVRIETESESETLTHECIFQHHNQLLACTCKGGIDSWSMTLRPRVVCTFSWFTHVWFPFCYPRDSITISPHICR